MMTKTALVGLLIWGLALFASIAVVYSMLAWALSKNLPFNRLLKWANNAHLRDKW